MTAGTLYLIPNTLGDGDAAMLAAVLPAAVQAREQRLDGMVQRRPVAHAFDAGRRIGGVLRRGRCPRGPGRGGATRRIRIRI